MTTFFRKHKRLQIKWLAVPLIVLMLTGILSSCTQTDEVDKVESDSPTTETTEQVIPTALYDEDSVISLYESSIPAVVMIIVEIEANGDFGFAVPQGGQGSGFIIDDQGHIITNNHVVEDATKVTVILHDERRLEAEVVGTDRESDVALLQVDAEKLGEVKPLLLGDSDRIKPGQMAAALGSPFGLDGSITVGIISGIGRSLSSASQRPNPEIIQTDAAINPGNSGGPLLNLAGEVVGINTAIEVSSTGIGFVVPINTVKSLLPALLRGGEVKNPWLGISAVPISPGLVESLELSVSSGIYVVTVTASSPAEQAGLIESGIDELGQPDRGGDVITAVDGIEVSAVEDLVAYLNDKEPGDEISLSVYRDGDYLTINVTLGEWPEEL
jgi:S1-C subfamily serine protease